MVVCNSSLNQRVVPASLELLTSISGISGSATEGSQKLPGRFAANRKKNGIHWVKLHIVPVEIIRSKYLYVIDIVMYQRVDSTGSGRA